MVERRHAKLGRSSRARANNAMRVLRALFNFAAGQYEDEQGGPLVTENPVRRLSATRRWYRVERRKTVIKKHELPAWFGAVLTLDPGVYDSPAGTARDYLLFLLFTGLRRSEAAKLTRADVDMQARTFVIADTKNREQHTLPLPDYLYDLLRVRLAAIGGDYIFPAAHGKRPLNDPRTWMEKVTEQSGVPFILHDLRRTFVTIAESLDVPAYTLKRLLNHKMDADVTAGYIVSDVERLRRPMRKISEYLLRVGKVESGSNVVRIGATSA
jgi:integrase